MMATDKTPQPLQNQMTIVNPDGTPTDYFIRWAQERQKAILDTTDAAQVQTLAEGVLAARKLIGGVGIDVNSGSEAFLSGDVTIDAKIQELLDLISSTRGSVLYRGDTAWEALAPGTAGQVLSTNGAGADPSWIAAGGGGGSSTSYAQSSASAASTSAYAGKGARVIPQANITISKLMFTVNEVAGRTYQAFVVTANSSHVIQTVAASAPSYVSGASGVTTRTHTLSTPVAITAGTIIGIMLYCTSTAANVSNGVIAGTSEVGPLPNTAGNTYFRDSVATPPSVGSTMESGANAFFAGMFFTYD